MSLNFKKVVLLQKNPQRGAALLAYSLFALFFLAVFVTAFASSEVYTNLQATPNKEASDNLEEFKNALYKDDIVAVKKLLLEKKIDAGLLLEVAFAQRLNVGNTGYLFTLSRQKEWIDLALEKEAKFSDIKIERLNKLPSFDVAKLMLENSFDPNKFLKLVIDNSLGVYNFEKKIYEFSDESIKHRNELVELGLDSKANASEFLSDLMAQQPEKVDDLIKMALEPERGAKFSDIKIERLNKLPSFDVSKLMLENSFDPNKFLKLVIDNSLGAYNFEKKIYEFSDESIKHRNELVKLGLDSKANASKFLSDLMAQQPEKVDDLIKMALEPERGAKFSDIKIERLNELPSSKEAELMLKNLFDPNKFIELIIRGHLVEIYNPEKKISEVSDELIKHRNELVRLGLAFKADADKFLTAIVTRRSKESDDLINIALENGADPNRSVVSMVSEPESLLLLKPSTIKLLFNNGHKKIDQDLFCHYLRVYGRSYYDIEGLRL